MKICLISTEIFAWDKYGGFGRATRLIGRELAKRGHEIYAVVPRRNGQKDVEDLDGITVLGFKPYHPLSVLKLFKKCNADIYHSCEPSFSSYLAIKAMPERKHIVTCRDPRDFNDWKMEFALPSLSKLQVLSSYFYENNPLVRGCLKDMDAVFTNAKYLIPKVKSMYGLKSDPRFLPTPVAIPNRVKKADIPTVCYIARLDRRKRPEIFLSLAEEFPHIEFIAVGKSRDRRWDDNLKEKYSHFGNLEMTGFIDQFSSDRHSKILEKSWVFVNTATREALPNSYLEAAAHKCAILSGVDADGFAHKFGYHAVNDDFSKGLEFLLERDRWKKRGEKGYEYVSKIFELNHTIDQHIDEYNKVLNE
ncbi:MAG: glycosyltransferase family 4 protein [Candidatus Hodarchaeales archaeon]|jgi:glycosyltransferase involved in cell wall biosynthesis